MPDRATDPIEELLRNIARVESGGDYSARGPEIRSGQYAGERALGKYQIMPGNLPSWSREALGREVTPDEFLASPELQDRIARHRVEQIYRRHGNPADVASVWHSGRPLAQAGGARDQNMSTQSYVQRVVGSQQGGGMDLERLEVALRNAHAAGDEAAARRLAAAILQLRQQQGGGASPAPVPARPDFSGVESGAASTAPAGAASPDPSTVHLQGSYSPADTLSADETRALLARGVERGEISPEEAEQEAARLTARERGRASVEPREGFNLPAAVQGYGSGMFGIGTPLTALGEMIASRFGGGEPMDWGQSLEFARGRRDQLREDAPREFYSGMGSSIVGGVGAVRAASAAAPRVAGVFAPQTGQTARNLARLSAAGAAAGGVTALNEQGLEEAPTGAALGAAAGPALVGAARVVGAPFRAAAGRIDPENAGLRLLAKRLKEPVDALQRRYDEFVQTRGRPPRLVEIMNREAAGEMGEVSRIRPAAGAVFRDAEEQAARQLPGEMAPLVREGTPATRAAARAAPERSSRLRSTPDEAVGKRDVEMDRAMRRIGDHEVPATPDMLEMLEDPDLMGALEGSIRRGVRRAIEDAGEEGTPFLSVRAWDAIRKELGRRANTESGGRYTQLRNEVRDYVSQAVPEYGEALERYGLRTDVARGIKRGSRVMSEDTRAFQAGLETAGGGTAQTAKRAGVRVAERRGAAQGARGKLTDTAGESPAGAARTAMRLAQDPGLQTRLAAALGPREQQRLTQLGTSVRESSRRLAEASPGSMSQASAEAQRAASDVQTIIGAVVIAGGRASGAMRANILYRMFEKTKLPKTATRKLAEMATDPARAHQVIARLRRAGMETEEIARMYQDAAAAAGILAGRD